MKFLANENIPKASVNFLRKNNIDVKSIGESLPGISDNQVIDLAIQEERTILTHDNDYGKLIFKYGFRPPMGVILFKLSVFQPEDPAKLLLTIISDKLNHTSLYYSTRSL